MTDALFFNPYIVCVNEGSVSGNAEGFERTCLWYELELILGGGERSGLYASDEFFPAEPGTLFLRRPGDSARGIAPYSSVTILFDVIYDPNLASWYALQEHGLMSDVDTSLLKLYRTDEKRAFSFIDRIPRVSHVPHYERLLHAMREVIALDRSSSAEFQFYAKAMLYSVLAPLSRDVRTDNVPCVACPPAVEKAREYVAVNYMVPISLEHMASQVSLNREYFCRLFRQYTGITPMAYLQQVRIENAKRLLVSEPLPVEEVANRCGFRDLSYFYSVFKKHAGMSPGQYRTSHISDAKLEV